MFLGAYHFDGEPTELLLAYHRLLDGFPPEAVQLQLCAVTGDGIRVLDTCPSREAFDGFTASPEFRAALAGAGLPQPRIEPIGDLHHVVATAAQDAR